MRDVFNELLSGKCKEFHEWVPRALVQWPEYEWINNKEPFMNMTAGKPGKPLSGQVSWSRERKQMEQKLLHAKEQAVKATVEIRVLGKHEPWNPDLNFDRGLFRDTRHNRKWSGKAGVAQ